MNTDHFSLAVDFGQGGNSHLYRRDGWSEPEPRHTWTSGFASNIELPRPVEPGEYMLELHVHPFTFEGKIPAQKLTVMVNDSEVADFDIRVISSLECPLPWDLLESSDAVSVKFVHPGAASRRVINGEPDERLIALAFRRINLRRLREAGDDPADGTAASETGDVLLEETRADEPALPAIRLEGHVDIYGYYPPGECWVFVGWASRSWTPDEITAIVAQFDDRDETGPAAAAFYVRPALAGQGMGVVVTMPSKLKRRQLRQLGKSGLVSLRVEGTDFVLPIEGHAKPPAAIEQLVAVLQPILSTAGADSALGALLPQLLPDVVAAGGSAVAFEGHVDLCSHVPALGGWFYLGWTSHPWTAADTPTAIARYSDRELSGELTAAFYDRGDVQGRGVGCILFMPGAEAADETSALLSLDATIGTGRVRLQGGAARRPVPVRSLIAAIEPLLIDAAPDTKLAELKSLLVPDRPDQPEVARVFEGYIDFYGYHAGAAGWLFGGWVSAAWDEDRAPSVVAQFVDGDVAGEATATFYRRDDLDDRGVGLVLLVPSATGNLERLLSLHVSFGEFTAAIYATDNPPLGETVLLELVKPILFDNELATNRGGLRALLFGGAPAAPAIETAIETVAPAPPETPEILGGHVDFYGYHAGMGAWLFCGWVLEPWSEGSRPTGVAARFEDGTVSGETTIATFYYREDIEGRGVGFILAMTCPDGDRNNLISVRLNFAEFSATLETTAAGPSLPRHELVEWLTPLLTGGEANSNRARLREMLLPEVVEEQNQNLPQGFVDIYGYHSIGGGWLFCGWVSNRAPDTPDTATVTAQFEEGEVRGEAVSVYYARDDLGDRGLGIVLFIPGTGTPLGGLLSVMMEAYGVSFRIYPGTAVQRLREQDLITRIRAIVAGAAPSPQRETMLAVLRRQGFTGANTIGELSDPVFIEFDEAIYCEPNSLVLIGWYLAKPGVVRSLRLRCGSLASAINLEESVKIDRPDVLTAVGQQHGFDDFRCGFIVFLPNSVDGANAPYIEIETRRREVGYRPVPNPRLEGIAATRRLLECFDVRFLDVPRAYDRVIGPAVELLNKARLKTRPKVDVVEFGTVPRDPEFSVIVPLYGRIDFVEYQLAFFSAHPPSQNYEFIYVLDDPPKRREAQFLFASTYERFRLPFRALLLDRNVGFAPTNNIGLQHAHGKYVCFLNSDAFSGTPDWLERLAAKLAANPELGAIGPLLLYEDGSIQHQGMSFRQLNEFGDWYFGHHPGKGMQRGNISGMRKCISITGACILMERALAQRMHGFDEAYAIGDFEDSDLCLKLYRMGLASAVDLDVHLYHLERKSQTSSGHNWRLNMTLYNAWFHQRRWARAIAAHPQAFDTAPLTVEA